MLGYLIFGIYVLSLLLILIYSLAQAHLTYSYLRSKKEKREIPSLPDQLPKVTVQLPVFNELYVVERLLRKVAELDYPSHLLEIQVLDDSTDECLELSRKLVDELATTGLDIKLIERPERIGFKAGALAYGLERANGEFIAIFDADFLPPKDFLIKTLPYFEDAEIGIVQTKWEHLNQDFNVLTRLLAMALDAHFTVEQKGRNASGSFMNFNGTAGIWAQVMHRYFRRLECGYVDRGSGFELQSAAQRLENEILGRVHFASRDSSILVCNSLSTIPLE